MNRSINTIKTILLKDITGELRSGQTVSIMIMLSGLIALIFKISAEDDGITTVPAVIVTGILFSAILLCEKTMTNEADNDCLGALLLTCSDAGDIYIAKLLANTTILCIFEIIFIPAVFVIFNVPLSVNLMKLMILIVLVNIAICSVATTLSAAVQDAGMKNCLLTVLLLAVITPAIIPVTPAISDILTATNRPLTNSFCQTVKFLSCFNIIYIACGWLLFGFVIRK